MIKKILLGVGGLALGLGIGLVVIRKNDLLMLNPMGIWDRNEVVDDRKKEVVGFLPTWMVGKTKLYGKELSHLVFLGVEVEEDGSLVWDVQSKKIDSDAYVTMRNEISKSGGKNILGIKLFEDKKIEVLLASKEAREKLREEVEVIVKLGKFDGVNIDFEYMSNPTWILGDDFGSFVDELRQSDWGEISVDVFANTIIKGDGERLGRLLGRVDRVIVMAYDFHRPGSDFAGPVAPIAAEVGERSLNEITAKIVDFNLAKEKIVLAYPLYGYKWETVDDSWGSRTMENGYGATVLYSESVGFTGVKYDEKSMTPWLTWTEKEKRSKVQSQKVGKIFKKVTTYYDIDQWHQVYFENEQSLRVKVDLARQAEVAGVGYWALGYEGKESNLLEELGKIIGRI